MEVLVASFVISTVLAGTFSIFSMNRNIALRTRHSFIASGLAQEGIEVVRNLRDSDWIAGRDFGSFGSSQRVIDGNYTVAWSSQELTPLAASEESALYLNRSLNAYVHNSGNSDKTIYNREVSITTGTSGSEKIVIVTVWWLEKSDNRMEIRAEEHLYDWY
ncbi:MAG: hypothetical protein CEN90_249 [Parcubacteria group bacterium Licking1014_17]|nr:MAG: hypothetical protein CEN90_249 [Parcubacteria group bacterium Licking1014_17]